ncbi:MAG: hypothetical protein RL432_1465 [Bacteroidota bacterium]|jgi:hypothetical protein
MRVAHALSVVLATLSFLATKAFESFGVERFYQHQARNFKKEAGYFDVGHPDLFARQSAFYHLHRFAALDSTHWLYKPQCCIRGLVFQSLDSNKVLKVNPLPESQEVVDFISVDSLLFLIDAEMDVYQSTFPFDSLSTFQVSHNKPMWESSALCFHKPTKRIIFCAPKEEGEGRQRALYYYSLSKQRYHEEPIFCFDADEVIAFLDRDNVLVSQVVRRKTRKSIPEVLPNAIAVHPKTNDFYMLSSKERLLMVFSPFGEILDVTYLEDHVYLNPTDLHFNAQGDLIIANEIKNGISLVKLPWNRLWQSMANKEEMPFLN